MSEDSILERAKGLLCGWNIQRYAGNGEWEPIVPTEYQAVKLLPELIAEVEAKNDKIAQDAITIQMHHENVLALQKEVERLRSTPKSGLYGKYIIQKADGSPVDPRADYFLLRLDSDPYARIAALEYAIQTDDQTLGEALEKRVMSHVFSPDDQCRKRRSAWPLGLISRLRKEFTAKNARIAELEAAVVDARAQYLLFLHDNPGCNAWNFDELEEADQDTLRQQAMESLKMEEPWTLVQLREARTLIERLEAAFLEAKRCPSCEGRGVVRCNVFHQIDGQMMDMSFDRMCPLCEGKGEERSCEELERIKEGKG